MGGTDDPSNLIELTVKEHAEAHKQLWLLYNKEEDNIAWRMLAGRITPEEARIAAAAIGSRRYRLGRPHTNETKEKMSASRKKWLETNSFSHSDETKHKLSQSHSGKTLSDEHKNNIRNKMSKEHKPKVICPHCSKVGGKPQMIQWHFDNCKEK
jgi:hypothetical protein